MEHQECKAQRSAASHRRDLQVFPPKPSPGVEHVALLSVSGESAPPAEDMDPDTEAASRVKPYEGPEWLWDLMQKGCDVHELGLQVLVGQSTILEAGQGLFLALGEYVADVTLPQGTCVCGYAKGVPPPGGPLSPRLLCVFCCVGERALWGALETTAEPLSAPSDRVQPPYFTARI